MSKRLRDPRWAPVIYSMFIFPGLGQLNLGRRVRGVLFIVLTLACFVGFVVQFFGPFQKVIMSHLDPSLVSGGQDAGNLLTIVFRWIVLLLIVWVGSGLDAYFISWRNEKRPTRKTPARPSDQPQLPPPPTPGLRP